MIPYNNVQLFKKFVIIFQLYDKTPMLSNKMKKYQEIYNDLKEKIRTNVYPAETSLPTEQHCKNTASLYIVLKALAILTERGMIQKFQEEVLCFKTELLNFPYFWLNFVSRIDGCLCSCSQIQRLLIWSSLQ